MRFAVAIANLTGQEEDREKGKVSRPMVDLAESRDGSIHHLTFQYLGLISKILKRFRTP